MLRHLLDEGFICSVLEHGQREHALGACEGVLYYKVGSRAVHVVGSQEETLRVVSLCRCRADLRTLPVAVYDALCVAVLL